MAARAFFLIVTWQPDSCKRLQRPFIRFSFIDSLRSGFSWHRFLLLINADARRSKTLKPRPRFPLSSHLTLKIISA
jgi:hypothetical protein